MNGSVAEAYYSPCMGLQRNPSLFEIPSECEALHGSRFWRAGLRWKSLYTPDSKISAFFVMLGND